MKGKEYLPESIINLIKLEKDFDAIRAFRYKDTSSWIRVKNYLYNLTLNSAVNVGNFSVKEFFTKNGVTLIAISLKNYLLNAIDKKEKTLFVSAGSGLFYHKEEVLDTFLPKYINLDESIYLLSGDHVEKLIKFKEYITKNRAIIYSYLVGPIKVILTKLFARFIKFDINSDIIEFLKENGMDTTKEDLQKIHANFIITIYLYKLFLLPFKIKKAYIISAYSNSEIIYLLKKRGIEVIELQHGIIGSAHRAYNYAKKDALLPAPQKIDVYNNFWKEELIKAGFFKAEDINVVGRWKYDLIDKNLTIFDNRYLLFTGQGGFYEKIIKLFNKANRYLEDNRLKVLYLPHPNETKEMINRLKKEITNPNVIVLEQNKKYTTEQYIYNSLAHISVYSSCHFDTMHYKDKTYIFDILKDNPMNYYIKNFPNSFIPIKKLDDIKI